MKLGIIGAMEIEVALLKEHLEDCRLTALAGMEFNEGVIGSMPAVVVRSGIGKVNAAVCTQLLIDRFGVTHIINTGAAGSLNNDINIGDFVISTDVMYHDVDGTFFGYAPGEVPQMGIVSFPADPDLRMRAISCCRSAAPDVGVFEGRVASGDQFVHERPVKDHIREITKADCCEMEGCAIAHTSYLNRTPFVIIRAISDKADESMFVSYDEFEKKAAADCAALVLEMVKAM